MNANTEIELAVLHDAIVADIKAQFPDLVTVEFYRAEEGQGDDERKTLPVPACLLELSEMTTDPDRDPGTEQLAVTATFEARLIIDSFKTLNAKLSIRVLAAAFSAWLRLRRWNNPAVPGKCLPTGPAYVIGAYPDDFSPELDRYEVWRVEWQQEIHLGSTVWNDEGVTPSIPVFSWSPAIGPGHEDDYTEVLP